MTDGNQAGKRIDGKKIALSGLAVLGILFDRRARDPMAIFFCLFIVGVYFFANWAMHKDWERQKQTNDLHHRIVNHVKQHPEVKTFDLAALQAAGALSADDVKFMNKNHLTYHPVGAQSPEDALVLVQESQDTDHYYYKSGLSDFSMKVRSPDKSRVLVNSPFRPGEHVKRSLRVLDEASGKVLGSYDIEALSVSAQWSPDGRFVAIDRSIMNGNRVFLLQVDAARTQEIPLPDELGPENYVTDADRARGLHWNRNSITSQKWLSGNELLVESFGGATLGDPKAQPPETVYLTYHIVIRIKPDASAVISEKTRKRFARTKGNEVAMEP